MKYGYTSTLNQDSQGRYIKRPLVEVELFGKEKTCKAFGLIDSGADITLLNIEYARDLGIPLDPKNTKPFIGISGPSAPCYLSKVSMKLKDFENPIDIPVGFIESPSVDILLGQEGFFESYRIKFEKDHDTFELSVPRK